MFVNLEACIPLKFILKYKYQHESEICKTLTLQRCIIIFD